MHLLFIALLSILAGVLLLAKTRKEQLGKFFTYISWFFVVVGFVLFIGFITGAVCKMSNCCPPGKPVRHQMMMKGCPQGMEKGKCCSVEMKGGKPCSGGMMKGQSCVKMGCMKTDSVMKPCPGNAAVDSVKLP
jgi:hypothetical protein